MTIGCCAWMEREWLHSLDAATKQRFTARRYMDDILMFYAKDGTFDHERFLQDFQKSECYWEPLTLEPGKEDTFLETRFKIEGGRVTYRLKNDNETEKVVWRYKHYECEGARMQKRATMMGTMRRVHNMASDDDQLVESAAAKLYEFQQLGYPRALRHYVCSIMARDYSNITWRYVRGLQ